MKEMETPSISVIMSVYNGERYIVRSLLSLLAQNYSNFEIIVVNDGSTDNTLNKINSIRDGRIKIINQKNMGLTKSLNTALSLSQGKWIARQDADDFSISSRFEKQVNYLKNNDKVKMIGSSCFIQPERHGIINEIYEYPESHDDISSAMYLYNPFVHGSVMLERKLIVESGGYDESLRYVQDYDLWSRLINKTKTFNFKFPLYVRSVHKDTSQAKIAKEPIFDQIREKNVAKSQNNQTPIKEIQSISIYPSNNNSWNKSLTDTFLRISKEAKKHKLPYLKFQIQAFIYNPYNWLPFNIKSD